MLLHSCFTTKTQPKPNQNTKQNENKKVGGKLQNNLLMELLDRKNKMSVFVILKIQRSKSVRSS